MNTNFPISKDNDTWTLPPILNDVKALEKYGYVPPMSTGTLLQIHGMNRETLISWIMNSPHKKCDEETAEYLHMLMECGLSIEIALEYFQGEEIFPVKVIEEMQFIRSSLENILNKPRTLRIERESVHSLDVLSKILSNNSILVKVKPNTEIEELKNRMNYWILSMVSIHGQKVMYKELLRSQSINNDS